MNAVAHDAGPAAGSPSRSRTLLVCFAIFALIWLIAYYAAFAPLIDEIDAGEAKLQKLKDDYVVKATKAVDLESRRAQFRALAPMAAAAENSIALGFDGQIVELLQAARVQGVRIDELQMGTDVVLREYYAETRGRVRVSGPFHDLGAFVAQMASQDVPSVLQDLNIESAPDGDVVSMNATIRALRYLDASEVAAASKAARAKKK